MPAHENCTARAADSKSNNNNNISSRKGKGVRDQGVVGWGVRVHNMAAITCQHAGEMQIIFVFPCYVGIAAAAAAFFLVVAAAVVSCRHTKGEREEERKRGRDSKALEKISKQANMRQATKKIAKYLTSRTKTKKNETEIEI